MAGRFGKIGKNWTSSEEIIEVQELLAFEERNHDDLKRIRPLLEERDALIQAAEKAVRARNVSCDRFILLSQSETVNWEKLFDELGREKFMELAGGIIQTVPKYSGDLATYQNAVASGKIGEAIDQRVYRQVSRYTVRDR